MTLASITSFRETTDAGCLFFDRTAGSDEQGYLVKIYIIERFLEFPRGYTPGEGTELSARGNFIPQRLIDSEIFIESSVGMAGTGVSLPFDGGKLLETGGDSFIRDEIAGRLQHRRVGHSNKLEAGLLASRDGLLRWEKSA